MGPCVLLPLTGVLITNVGNDVTYDVTVDNVPFVSWESEGLLPSLGLLAHTRYIIVCM